MSYEAKKTGGKLIYTPQPAPGSIDDQRRTNLVKESALRRAANKKAVGEQHGQTKAATVRKKHRLNPEDKRFAKGEKTTETGSGSKLDRFWGDVFERTIK